jgi:hypothetical protein
LSSASLNCTDIAGTIPAIARADSTAVPDRAFTSTVAALSGSAAIA